MSVMQPCLDDTVTLPRRLAVRLLRTAQQAQDQPFKALLVSASQTAIPDTMLPLDEDWDAATAKRALLEKGRFPWGLYVHVPGRSGAPEPAEFGLGTDSLCLTSSIATKGVLQLYAWRCNADGQVCEVSMRIQD